MNRKSDGKWNFQKKPRVISSFEEQDDEKQDAPRYRLLHRKHEKK